MNKISIPSTRAYAAIVWASHQFGNGGYQIEHAFPSNLYEFKFERSDHATLFALRWT